jgi:oligopeptide transport system substrate-binding protein
MQAQKLLYRWVVALVAASLLLAACAGPTPTPERIVETVIVTQEVEVPVEVQPAAPEPAPTEAPPPTEIPDAGPVTYNTWQDSDPSTLDPQVGEDAVSIRVIENVFVHLTNYDLLTGEVVPETATSWSISEDGLVYTFKLRTDIPWVYHNPVSGETTQVLDDEGNPRFVIASDFVNGIRRACDPTIGGYYSSVIGSVLKGCADVLALEGDALTPEAFETIGVRAPADDTLEIELLQPAAYFLSMTPMWTLAAVPLWTIDEHGENWIEAGVIVTNGRYVLHEWVHGVRWTLDRNPLMPKDMWGEGNLDRVVTDIVPDEGTGYALWLNQQVDHSAIPDTEIQAQLAQFPDDTVQFNDLAVFYISFRNTKPPFDDARVRRAFSAAFDRATYVSQVLQNQGLPMTHFAPPGIFGAPPINETGVGYDVEYARQQLADAGYPNCEGFPQVTLTGYTGPDTLNWIEFAQAQWAENLGCSADLFQIDQLPFRDLLSATAAALPDEQTPHMWTLAWGPDYPDEKNWVDDVLWCGHEGMREKRPCSPVDELILQARTETDLAVRADLYHQIEEALFGPEGEMPFIPVYLRIAYYAEQPWVDRVQAIFGGDQYYNWKIDWAAKQAATR